MRASRSARAVHPYAQIWFFAENKSALFGQFVKIFGCSAASALSKSGTRNQPPSALVPKFIKLCSRSCSSGSKSCPVYLSHPDHLDIRRPNARENLLLRHGTTPLLGLADCAFAGGNRARGSFHATPRLAARARRRTAICAECFVSRPAVTAGRMGTCCIALNWRSATQLRA